MDHSSRSRHAEMMQNINPHQFKPGERYENRKGPFEVLSVNADTQALYFHHSLLQELPPILRVYCGCAEAYCGDLGRVDVIKLHRASGKLTFLLYDDIDHQSLPELRLRIKVNLRTGFVQVFDHSADHQVLCFKERFFPQDHPRWREWSEFGNKLRAVGVSDREFIGPKRMELDGLMLNMLNRAEADEVAA